MITTRAHGIDISYAQEKFDSISNNTADIDFVILKASQADFTDPNFNNFYAIAKEYPLRGAYHYFITSKVEIKYSEQNNKRKQTGNAKKKKRRKSAKKTKNVKNNTKEMKENYVKAGYDWEEQARYFLKVVDGKDFHFFALDIERNPGSEFYEYNDQKKRIAQGKNIFTNAEIQNIKLWVDFIKKNKPGIPVLLYTSADIYNKELLPNGGKILKNLDLWIARYPDNPNRNEADPFDEFPIKGVTDWRIWQYSANNNQKGPAYGVATRRNGAIQKDVDLNVFNGSIEDMKTWLGVREETKTPVLPPDDTNSSDQSITDLISQLDKLKLAGIKPNIRINLQQKDLDKNQIDTLVTKLKNTGIVPEVYINIQETSES